MIRLCFPIGMEFLSFQWLSLDIFPVGTRKYRKIMQLIAVFHLVPKLQILTPTKLLGLQI